MLARGLDRPSRSEGRGAEWEESKRWDSLFATTGKFHTEFDQVPLLPNVTALFHRIRKAMVDAEPGNPAGKTFVIRAYRQHHRVLSSARPLDGPRALIFGEAQAAIDLLSLPQLLRHFTSPFRDPSPLQRRIADSWRMIRYTAPELGHLYQMIGSEGTITPLLRTAKRETEACRFHGRP